jgi:hypothetical protein
VEGRGDAAAGGGDLEGATMAAGSGLADMLFLLLFSLMLMWLMDVFWKF